MKDASVWVFLPYMTALSHLIAMFLTFLFDFPFGRLDEMVTNYLDKQAIEEKEADKENEGENEEGEEEEEPERG